MKTINQFQNLDQITGFFLVKKCETKTASNNKKFMDFLLCDKTGEINAKLWDASEEHEQTYQANMLIKVRGLTKEWNGNLQLNIDLIRPVINEDGVELSDYVPSAPFDPEYMLSIIMDYVNQIQHPDIKCIINQLIMENRDKLLYYPAAQKNHHSIRSGWLYHIMTMLQAAEKMQEIYSFLNKDLLFAGVILHDLAKLSEMEANELGIVSNYTIEGQLLGHIVQGIKMVDKIATDIGADEEIILLLQHLILSHHYKGEWGSPKSPMIPEAEMLHHLDIIDAHMYDFKHALDNTEPGTMSDQVWTLSRRVYKQQGKL
ncbi:MAG TPA: CMP-binding protein [Paenibacillaceae bacterium]|nr:CMP-binding protein [Paenibacillaceae bacterium]